MAYQLKDDVSCCMAFRRFLSYFRRFGVMSSFSHTVCFEFQSSATINWEPSVLRKLQYSSAEMECLGGLYNAAMVNDRGTVLTFSTALCILSVVYSCSKLRSKLVLTMIAEPACLD